jgi:hypothetical protein
MKRTFKTLAFVCASALVFFTSCDEILTTEDDQPVITISAPAADTTSVAIGDTLDFSLDLSSASGLASLQTTAGLGIDVIDGSKTFNASLNETVTVSVVVNESATVGDVLEVNFTVANSSKQTTAKKLVKVLAKETVLSEAKGFEWKRVGGAAATGLEPFGLTWTSNTATNAVIKKGADKFVELDAAQWTSLTNLEGLKAAIDAATDMEKWEKVSSSSASKTYDYTLGTIKAGVYYLIHVTGSTVTVEAAGSTIVITGQYKQ